MITKLFGIAMLAGMVALAACGGPAPIQTTTTEQTTTTTPRPVVSTTTTTTQQTRQP
jgi:ABC-type glycerol-3-phosphate transport system substrate-binding protein